MRGAQVRRASAESGWLGRAVIAGFVATSLMTIALLVAYAFATGVGNPGGSQLARWLWALSHNAVVAASRAFFLQAAALHLAVGLALGVIYARFAAPVLPGRPWERGLLFALAPWLLSVVVFLPLLGGGLFGVRLEAGPLPALGNLILHLVYGAALGWTYEVGGSVWREDVGRPEAEAAATGAEAALAVGIVVGTALGAAAGVAAGVLLAGAALESGWGFALAGALLGAGAGAYLGPLGGLSRT